MEETITVDGKQFLLMTDIPLTAEQRGQAIAEIRKQSGCGCGKTVSATGVETLTNTCTRTSAFVGESITLKASAAGGTAPYTVVFTKGATQIGSFPSVAENTQVTQLYTAVTGDIGTQTFNVTVTDSCPGGAKSCTGTCSVTISACPVPTCTFIVT
jgi:hypothetical protein